MKKLYAAAAIAAALPFVVFAVTPAKITAAAPRTESTASSTPTPVASDRAS